MDCDRFQRWLDDGMPEAGLAPGDGAGPALAHAAGCRRCGAALAAERELDAILARPACAAPVGFADRVMERVARARSARIAALVEADAMPWWVRAAAEPVAAIALALAALVLWQRDAITRFSAWALQMLGHPAVVHALRAVEQPRISLDLSLLTHPFVLTGFTLAMLPLAWWAGLAVYHWSGDSSLRAHHV